MDWKVLLVDLVLMPLVAFAVGLVMVLMLRKVNARIQRRIGPPFFQPLYDILKLFGKQTQISHGVIHDIAIVMLLGGFIASETLLPVPGMDGLAKQGDLLVLIYLLMVPTLGMALGVGQCANPNGSIGISRALTSMLAYDIPLMVVVVGVAWHYGTTSLPEIIALQQQAGVSGWGVTSMPLLAVAGIVSIHMMLGKEPFEVYVAPAEIATGPMVEISGKYLGGLFVTQCFQLYTAGVLFTTLFLGGGENWLSFLVKIFAVLFVPIAITVVFPRFKVEEGVAWGWKWPTTIGLVGLALVFF